MVGIVVAVAAAVAVAVAVVVAVTFTAATVLAISCLVQFGVPTNNKCVINANTVPLSLLVQTHLCESLELKHLFSA